MSRPENQNCENCRYQFWATDPLVPESTEERAMCRRYPPEMDENQTAWGISTHPETLGWCGEWAPENPQTVSEGAATLARLVLLGDLTAARALADKLREDGP